MRSLNFKDGQVAPQNPVGKWEVQLPLRRWIRGNSVTPVMGGKTPSFGNENETRISTRLPHSRFYLPSRSLTASPLPLVPHRGRVGPSNEGRASASGSTPGRRSDSPSERRGCCESLFPRTVVVTLSGFPLLALPRSAVTPTIARGSRGRATRRAGRRAVRGGSLLPALG